MWFSNATCNPAAIHIGAEYCKGTEFGQPLVNSIFTLGLVIGLSVQETTLGTTVANLELTDTRFPSPVFHGDAVRSRSTVAGVRDSQSRPNAGIGTFLHQGFNQRNEEEESESLAAKDDRRGVNHMTGLHSLCSASQAPVKREAGPTSFANIRGFCTQGKCPTACSTFASSGHASKNTRVPRVAGPHPADTPA